MSLLADRDCRLRPLEPEDRTLLQRWENDDQLWDRGEGRRPYSRYTWEQYLAQAQQSLEEAGQLRLLIEYRQAPVGLVDLYDYQALHLRAGVGVMIAEEALRGRGIARMALALLAAYAADQYHLQQLYAEVRAENAASLALFDRAGYRRVGERRRWLRRGANFSDVVLFELLLDSPPY